MRLLVAFVTACIATLAAPVARAADYPMRPVRIVIPYGPGGGTDNLVRMLAPLVTKSLGQPLVIENRPGASTQIGTEMVAKAAADGYTLLATDTALLVNPGLFRKLPYDTLADLTGVTMMARAPVLLVSHPSVPAKTVPELIALARSQPGKLVYSSGGNGTSPHLAAELFQIAADIKLTHVPYKGTAPALNDLLAGVVQLSFVGISTGRQQAEAGRLNALALTGTARNAAMPNVPTFQELGIRGVEDADSFWGLYAPAGTPAEVLETVHKHVVAALRSPELADRLAAGGYLPIGNTPAEHTAQMKTLVQRWREVTQRAGIQIE